MRITILDLQPIIQKQKGTAYWQAALSRCQDGRQLLAVLGQFANYSAEFAGCVAILAGIVALKNDWFAGRSQNVASPIFRAAVDEFSPECTHAELAHRTLAACMVHFRIDAVGAASLMGPTPATVEVTAASRSGYAATVNPEKISPEALFEAIGFHLSSEMLAAEEFRFLDSALCLDHPQLVVVLIAQDVYTWVELHTHVEMIHLSAAYDAANRAIECSVVLPPDKARDSILRGFERFADMHTRFFRKLAEGESR